MSEPDAALPESDESIEDAAMLGEAAALDGPPPDREAVTGSEEESSTLLLDDPTGLRRSIQDDLARLEASGAGAYDKPALDLIRHLLERARELEPEARALLEGRAAARLSVLEEAYTRERERARAALEALAVAEPHGAGVLEDALEDLEGGRVDKVLRMARRRATSDESFGTEAEREARAASGARLYRDELADLTVSFSRAQSADTIIEQPGLLNGRVLAARLLEEAEAISPAYRRTLVAGLVDLATLLHLPELKSPRKRR